MPRSSGRFVLRIEPALHDRLRRTAAHRGSSLNKLCAELLAKGLGGASGLECAAGIAGDLAPGALVAAAVRSLRGDLAGLVLFGSAARGEAWENSDVDLLVVLRRGASVTRGLYAKWDAEMAPPEALPVRKLSPHFVALPPDAGSAGAVWFEIALDGVVLWDPQLEVSRMLSALRRQIASGSLVRRHAHGQPYWVRVPRTA